jgi:predicted dehydrogenase
MDLIRQNRWGNWIDDGGGVLMTKAIHQLDLLLWLFGPVLRVQAMMGTFVCPIESEDHLVANLEFENGALASVSLSGCPHIFLAELEIVGDQGMAGMPWNLQLKVNNAVGSLAAELDRRFPFAKGLAFDKLLKNIERMGGERVGRLAYKVAKRLPVVKSHVTDRGASNKHSHSSLVRQFVKAIEGQAEVPVTVDEARNAVELCMAIYISALTSEIVKLPLENNSKFYGGIDLNEVSECEHAVSPSAES